ncbi:hypothetical protein FOPG_19920, partial [Fusarium oxysporum f. sp. conglutinans race 2 54008]
SPILLSKTITNSNNSLNTRHSSSTLSSSTHTHLRRQRIQRITHTRLTVQEILP